MQLWLACSRFRRAAARGGFRANLGLLFYQGGPAAEPRERLHLYEAL